jgi:tetratricopeptide (TPR) repeat protein
LTSALPELPEKVENAGNHFKELDATIASNPNNAEAYFRRGLAYENLGKYHSALQDFNKAVELNPKDAAAYFMRGLTYGMIDVTYDSIKDIKVSARLGYKPAQSYMNAMGVPW